MWLLQRLDVTNCSSKCMLDVRTHAVTARSLQRDLQTASIVTYLTNQSEKVCGLPWIITFTWISWRLIPVTEARRIKPVWISGTSAKCYILIIFLRFFVIFFYFLKGGVGIFDEFRFSVNFNFRRILMNRHRGERFVDVKERQDNLHSGVSVNRMSALKYTSLTGL